MVPEWLEMVMGHKEQDSRSAHLSFHLALLCPPGEFDPPMRERHYGFQTSKVAVGQGHTPTLHLILLSHINVAVVLKIV